jgi:hypothetical protein
LLDWVIGAGTKWCVGAGVPMGFAVGFGVGLAVGLGVGGAGWSVGPGEAMQLGWPRHAVAGRAMRKMAKTNPSSMKPLAQRMVPLSLPRKTGGASCDASCVLSYQDR